MTLICTCGSHALEIQSQSYTDDTAFESYACQACGRTGTYTFGSGTDRMTGCVTTDY